MLSSVLEQGEMSPRTCAGPSSRPRQNRAAITTSDEAGALLRAIDDYDGMPIIRKALRLIAHVFVRPGELLWAEWKEFDLKKKVWTIPG
jgi:integrase